MVKFFILVLVVMCCNVVVNVINGMVVVINICGVVLVGSLDGCVYLLVN